MADSLKKSWLHWEMQSLVSSNNRPLHFLQLAPSWLPYIFFAQNTFSLWVSEFSSKNSKDWECTTAFRVCAFGWPCTQLNLFMGIFLKLLCLKVLTALFSMRLKNTLGTKIFCLFKCLYNTTKQLKSGKDKKAWAKPFANPKVLLVYLFKFLLFFSAIFLKHG